jgi:hypothetical protein
MPLISLGMPRRIPRLIVIPETSFVHGALPFPFYAGDKIKRKSREGSINRIIK